jgi:hypothetical protein
VKEENAAGSESDCDAERVRMEVQEEAEAAEEAAEDEAEGSVTDATVETISGEPLGGVEFEGAVPVSADCGGVQKPAQQT